MKSFLKTKFKRLILMGSIFALLALIGLGISITSATMQRRLQTSIATKLMQPDLNSFTRYTLSLSSEEQKTYLVLAILLGIMGGFCLAAAAAIRRQSR